MSRPLRPVLRVLSALAFLLVAGCGDREVPLVFRTPAQCYRTVDAGPAATCPMAELSSMRITVVRASGEVAHDRCLPRPTGACNYEDLRGVALLGGVAPTEGLDIRLEGFYGSGCGGRRHFFCDSPGDNLVDLRSEIFPVELWCSCAPVDG